MVNPVDYLVHRNTDFRQDLTKGRQLVQPTQFDIRPSYRGANPPKDPLGQSFNDFYKQDVERMKTNIFDKPDTDDRVMTEAIRWISENLSMFSFESVEDEQAFIHEHLDRRTSIIQKSLN